MINRRYSNIIINNNEFIKKIKGHEKKDSQGSYLIEKTSSLLLEQTIPDNTPKVIRWSDEEMTLTFEYLDEMVDLRDILRTESVDYALELFNRVFELLISFEKMSLRNYGEYRSFDGFELRNLGWFKGKIIFFDPHNYCSASIEKDIARFIVSYLMLYWPSPRIDWKGFNNLKIALKDVDYDRAVLKTYIKEISIDRNKHAKASRNFIIRLYVSGLFFIYGKILKTI